MAQFGPAAEAHNCYCFNDLRSYNIYVVPYQLESQKTAGGDIVQYKGMIRECKAARVIKKQIRTSQGHNNCIPTMQSRVADWELTKCKMHLPRVHSSAFVAIKKRTDGKSIRGKQPNVNGSDLIFYSLQFSLLEYFLPAKVVMVH